MSGTRVAILGAGPAGLGAAWQLARGNKADVIVVEQRDDVGGNAGSFELDGIPVDYGSHRLHPACQPFILEDIRALLKGDLFTRPRHGRIRLRGHWIHFPLRAVDLAVHLPWSFGLGVAWDALLKAIPRSPSAGADTFASVLERSLGRTICRDFYFPYATKIWGVPPDELSAVQAYRRVSALSLSKMLGKVAGLLFRSRETGQGRDFFYPRYGYGQISRSMATAARGQGAEIHLRTVVKRVHLGPRHRIEVERDGEVHTIEADHIWSTIPIPTLIRLVQPPPGREVLEASCRIEYRAMVLVYLVLAQTQFTPFDAHYFPEAEIKLARLSEPKNYSGLVEPEGRTVLCGELPCTVDDGIWLSSDDQLADLVCDCFARCGLPVPKPFSQVTTRRLAQAYPIYHQAYEQHFSVMDDWVWALDRVLTFGRQGLFTHDNAHHALAMAYAAAECLDESGGFDKARWRDYRSEFEKHVVED